jgi:hypothetical protein
MPNIGTLVSFSRVNFPFIKRFDHLFSISRLDGQDLETYSKSGTYRSSFFEQIRKTGHRRIGKFADWLGDDVGMSACLGFTL